MHDFSYYVHVIVDFFRDGFEEGFARVNAVLGLLIALIAAFLMPAWKRIWTITLGATLVHLIANVMLPVVANHETFRLPRGLLEFPYWRDALALYFGYLVVITIFFFIKTQVLPKPATAKH